MTDPLDQLSRDELKALVYEQAQTNTKLRRIFMHSTTVDVQAAAKEAPEVLLHDPTETNVRDLRDEYRKRQLNFDTAPFDPPGDKFRMFPGGVTIWSGYPGSGKTTLLRQLACHLLHAGRGVYIASLEERPDDSLVRLMMTAAGSSEPTEHQMQWFVDAYGDRVRFWGMIGLAKTEHVLGTVKIAGKQGIRHAIIDSLTCLDVGASDWDGQRGLANGLASLARSSGMHIHLVAHPRKPNAKQEGPDLADVAGSSDLSRLADNVVFIRRAVDTESLRFDDATPMLVTVRKQRHGTGMCGDIQGWFHRAHRQYQAERWWSGPTRYLPDHAYEGAA